MAFFLTRARECTATGLRMIKPSFTNFLIFCPKETDYEKKV